MNNLQILDSSILLKYTNQSSIALVGNSGVSDIEQSIINGCGIIARFNNYATRKNIDKTKDPYQCDILFSTFDLHSVDSQPKDVVIGIPFPFKAEEILEKPMRWYPRSRHWMINPYQNMKMCLDMNIDSLGASHPLPSLGFTALWHMRNWPIKIHVCGFNWYCNPNEKTIQGVSIYDTKPKDSWNHNYKKEAIWIIKNLMHKDNIIFSPDCLRILNFIKISLGI